MQCLGFKKNGDQCTRKSKNKYCFQHSNVKTKREIADLELLNCQDEKIWELAYKTVMDVKYQKLTRNYTKTVSGEIWKDGEPPIFIVPRVRGESYKDVKLDGVDDVYYAPISKGFSMQDVSSFVIGPIIGEGLCLVNAAFSKEIGIVHIEGGGKFNEKRKTFWQKARKPKHTIEILDDKMMLVDNDNVNIVDWLQENKDEWYPEWKKWSNAVALCGMGNFHWNDGEVVKYLWKDEYLNFVEWKKKCYIGEAYKLLEDIPTFKWLRKVWTTEKRPLGLVHPKGKSGDAEKPITREFIRNIYDSDTVMSCMPYVVAGKLLGVDIN